MFERFTDRARRAIFHARDEASVFKARAIETHHLLLGASRADPELAARVLGSEQAAETLREEFRSLPSEDSMTPPSQDLPVGHGCKRALAYAAEEADRVGMRQIAVGHLLLGVMREQESPAYEALKRRGLSVLGCRPGILDQPETAWPEDQEAGPSDQR